MTISYKWLCDYLKTPLEPSALADIITAIGLEVEEMTVYESIKGGLFNVVVGEVLTVEKIPDTEKLKVTTVNVGAEAPLQIVCGAANVAIGQKVIVATNGAVLYPSGTAEPLKIKKSKIRGVESNGMICAEDELGLSEDHSGIMVLNNDAQVGMQAADYLGIYTDTLFEVGLTPNRNDAFSHLGVAREVAAYLGYHHPEMQAVFEKPIVQYLKMGEGTADSKSIQLEISDTQICPRYAGVLIENIKIEESPAWLKNKLKAIGVASINNIVDITNFVLHETGQPLHAFDADKIAGRQVIVRKAVQNEPFTLLDGRDIKLNNDDIVVCDAEKPMCIAGVYGGAYSGITAGTTSLFLESAAFDMKHIRRTSMRHNLRTDAALHFEKGTDHQQVLFALNRAVGLIKDICQSAVSGNIVEVNHAKEKAKQIKLSYAKVNDTIGVEINPIQIEKILTGLDFEFLEKTDTHFIVKVPSFKLDVEQAADVIEEILRIYGFDNIPLSTHISFAHVSVKRTRDQWRKVISQYLAALGFNEIVNNSIVNSQRSIDDLNSQVKLLSYKNAGLDSLRISMLPSVLDVLAYNQKRRILNARVFEFGRVFSIKDKPLGDYIENEQICLALMGNMDIENWLSKEILADWKMLKPAIEACFRLSGLEDFKVTQIDNTLQYHIGETSLAYLSKANKAELEGADVKGPIWYAVIHADVLFNNYIKQTPRYKEPSKFPSIKRDIAMMINMEVAYSNIDELIRENGGKHLKTIHVFDVYRGDKIEAGKQSYAVSLEFNNPAQSLVDSEVNKVTDKIKAALEKQLGAVIR